MKARKAKGIDKLLADDALIETALTKGVRDALRRHRQAGFPVVEWRNGKIVWIAPEDIHVDKNPVRRKVTSQNRSS